MGKNNTPYTTETFIEKAITIHGFKYDYSKVNYINSKSKIVIICRKHGEFLQTPNDHLDGCKCRKCKYEIHNNNRKLTEEMFLNKAIQIHGNIYDYSEVKFKNSHIKVKIICKSHGVFLQTPRNHLSKRGCPICKSSLGELKIMNYLLKKHVKFKKEHKFKHCINPITRRHLRFDFYLPKYNLCIEYHGRQHYIPESFGSDKSDAKKEQHLLNTKFRDNIKEEFCKNNNINLLIIPYVDKDLIEDIVSKCLLSSPHNTI